MTAAEPRRDLHHHRAARPDAKLGVRRPLADAERLDRGAGDLDDRLLVVQGGPGVRERHAERGRVGSQAIRHRERGEPTVERERVHGHLRSFDVLLDEGAPGAGLGQRLLEGGVEIRPIRHEREPALSLAVGRLHDAREREGGVARVERPRVRHTGRCERLPLPCLRGGDRAGARVDRVRQAEALGDACGDAHGPVGAGRDDPGDLAGAGEAVDALLVLGREDGALVRLGEADGLRVAVDGDHVEVGACPRGLQQAELGRAGP